MLVAVFDVVKSYKGLQAQQDGVAHVRVEVVHHFHAGCGVRRNQRAGSASIPLKGGGGILAFPLRGQSCPIRAGASWDPDRSTCIFPP